MDAVVWITGNVGTEVECRTVRDELVFASFRLACTPRIRRGGEWGDGETTWLGVTCSRALAENVRASVKKGDALVVVGKLRTTRWEDTERGAQERLTIEAITIGHDLNRGIAQFRRNTRVVRDDSVSVAELIVATENQDDDEASAKAA
ncbi:single-stranded DNA-binding protein [Propionicimonas sp.]|uniref:single-stranded DNA-binding protein n=1 Tax=Propionicimonas sp. TaxID=1955623 RepID=UPI0018095ADB|nr:single-stranded DNA-binding protein [Propionicimonas sp.]MBU3977838.1 single-stranded DNA-binding protein [Actinomycetota bacterium]MBA3021937.1 single-stranded DNA-binding protein [Propionicimonas sp.]MBU3987615.1 single-stranded DNA-binding protein [Actinomycetota bacterium]MBU4007337.1 single-stranded DNA-binding protein [Actinomycetota bacterium]MBU4065717.1 single-stranded DNA-binding protein [Actinomycetota bacterium]